MLAKRVTSVALAALLAACGDGVPTQPEPEVWLQAASAANGRIAHFTGDVDVVWNGGQGSGPSAGADRISRGSISAFIEEGGGRGSFTFQVIDADGTIHREIGVDLIWVGLEDQLTNPGEIRFLGVVVSDTKPCGGSGHGSGGCGDDEGGCSHDDGSTHDEGGCSHDDGSTHEEGGCSHDDGSTHEEGGCSGGGGMGGPGETGGGGGKVNGSDCRIGQIVVGWALDGGTPALNGDRISWKWFAPDAPKVLQIQQAIAAGGEIPWPCKLCEKEILGGNLVLHLRKG